MISPKVQEVIVEEFRNSFLGNAQENASAVALAFIRIDPNITLNSLVRCIEARKTPTNGATYDKVIQAIKDADVNPLDEAKRVAYNWSTGNTYASLKHAIGQSMTHLTADVTSYEEFYRRVLAQIDTLRSVDAPEYADELAKFYQEVRSHAPAESAEEEEVIGTADDLYQKANDWYYANSENDAERVGSLVKSLFCQGDDDDSDDAIRPVVAALAKSLRSSNPGFARELSRFLQA